MLVITVSEGYMGSIGRDRDGVNTSRTLGELDELFLLASLSVPHEDSWSGSNLSSCNPLAVARHREGCNIIGVTLRIIRDILCFHLNITSAEKLLRVSLSVQDNT